MDPYSGGLPGPPPPAMNQRDYYVSQSGDYLMMPPQQQMSYQTTGVVEMGPEGAYLNSSHYRQMAEPQQIMHPSQNSYLQTGTGYMDSNQYHHQYHQPQYQNTMVMTANEQQQSLQTQTQQMYQGGGNNIRPMGGQMGGGQTYHQPPVPARTAVPRPMVQVPAPATSTLVHHGNGQTSYYPGNNNNRPPPASMQPSGRPVGITQAAPVATPSNSRVLISGHIPFPVPNDFLPVPQQQPVVADLVAGPRVAPYVSRPPNAYPVGNTSLAPSSRADYQAASVPVPTPAPGSALRAIVQLQEHHDMQHMQKSNPAVKQAGSTRGRPYNRPTPTRPQTQTAPPQTPRRVPTSSSSSIASDFFPSSILSDQAPLVIQPPVVHAQTEVAKLLEVSPAVSTLDSLIFVQENNKVPPTPEQPPHRSRNSLSASSMPPFSDSSTPLPAISSPPSVFATTTNSANSLVNATTKSPANEPITTPMTSSTAPAVSEAAPKVEPVIKQPTVSVGSANDTQNTQKQGAVQIPPNRTVTTASAVAQLQRNEEEIKKKLKQLQVYKMPLKFFIETLADEAKKQPKATHLLTISNNLKAAFQIIDQQRSENTTLQELQKLEDNCKRFVSKQVQGNDMTLHLFAKALEKASSAVQTKTPNSNSAQLESFYSLSRPSFDKALAGDGEGIFDLGDEWSQKLDGARKMVDFRRQNEELAMTPIYPEFGLLSRAAQRELHFLSQSYLLTLDPRFHDDEFASDDGYALIGTTPRSQALTNAGVPAVSLLVPLSYPDSGEAPQIFFSPSADFDPHIGAIKRRFAKLLNRSDDDDNDTDDSHQPFSNALIINFSITQLMSLFESAAISTTRHS